MKTTDMLKIVLCDFDNEKHCDAVVNLMNEYKCDKMGDGFPYEKDQTMKLIAGLRDHPSKLVLLALQGEQCIGLITCFINFATFTVKPFINIHDVIIASSWRNSGVGRKLLEKVVEKATDIGCSKITLEVREDNHNAKHLYSNMGFHDANPRQYYWSKYL
jgi:ribosomal protein S18 acetylase RimI-like enzyme